MCLALFYNRKRQIHNKKKKYGLRGGPNVARGRGNPIVDVRTRSDAVQDDIPIHELYADGDTRFVRVAGSMYFAEFVAAYLALLWGEDPADPAP